ELPHLPRPDRERLVGALLARRGKQLSADQLTSLLDADARPDVGLPLYLRGALEGLCLFGDYDPLSERIRLLPASLVQLFDPVLARLEHDHGRALNEAILPWLAVSRSGLLESEILDLLGDTIDVPRLRWIQYYRALEVYLRPMDEASGAGRLDFYHDQLRLAVYRRF